MTEEVVANTDKNPSYVILSRHFKEFLYSGNHVTACFRVGVVSPYHFIYI